MLVAILDINILVSSLLSTKGPPAEIVDEWEEGAFDLVVSPLLLDELERAAIKDKIAGRVDPRDVAALREALLRDAVQVGDPPGQYVPGDPGDDYLVALAFAAEADVIVTGDKHLLELGLERPRVVAPGKFRAWLADVP